MMKLTIKYTLTAPLSHIGETASTGSYFQTILTKNGKLPVITANSIRGQIRDSGAKHLLDTLGIKVDKDVFHVLFSGGNLAGTMKNDIEKAQKVREFFPLISVLGGGLGDIILSGKMNLTFAYPVCIESEDITKIPSDLSWHKMIEEMEFTRTDDSKNDKLAKYIEDIEAENTAKASTQMRYSVQYIAAGTEFIQTINLINANELEKGALIMAIAEWFKNPTLGGMASKGFGFFDANVNGGGIYVNNGIVSMCDEYSDLMSGYEHFIQKNDIENNFDWLKAAKDKKKPTKKEIARQKEISEIQKIHPDMLIEHIEDCLSIQEFAIENGYLITIRETKSFWEKLSKVYVAGWTGHGLKTKNGRKEMLSQMKEYFGGE